MLFQREVGITCPFVVRDGVDQPLYLPSKTSIAPSLIRIGFVRFQPDTPLFQDPDGRKPKQRAAPSLLD